MKPAPVNSCDKIAAEARRSYADLVRRIVDHLCGDLRRSGKWLRNGGSTSMELRDGEPSCSRLAGPFGPQKPSREIRGGVLSRLLGLARKVFSRYLVRTPFRL